MIKAQISRRMIFICISDVVIASVYPEEVDYWASEASPTLGCSIKILRDIREYGSTLYVGLARAVSPTNTNFRLTFLLTRLQEALYEDLAV